MASRETENNAYAKFWGEKQRALWYVMVFLEWSIEFYQSDTLKQKGSSKFKILGTFAELLARSPCNLNFLKC